MKPHHVFTVLPLAPLTSLQVGWIKFILSTPQIISGINFTAPWHGRQQRVTKHSVVKLGIVFPNSLSSFHLLTATSSTSWWWQHHTDARSCHCSLLSWSLLVPSHTQSGERLHEHQQVLGTRFPCTACLSHSRGEWISVVPCKEAVFFQNKQKPQTKLNQKDGFSP